MTTRVASRNTHPLGGSGASNDGVAQRLIAGLNNPEKGVQHHCFAYAWNVIRSAGGKGLDSAPKDQSCAGMPASSLGQLAASGKIHVGDVIYTNLKPGADPSSSNLAYGPHWFVYMGNNQFADQYGVKSADEMASTANWAGNAKIDTIFHCFDGNPAAPPAGALAAAGAASSGSSGDSSAVSGGNSPSSLGLPSSGGSSGGYSGGSSVGSSGGASSAGSAASASQSANEPMPSGNVAQWIQEAIAILEAPPYNLRPDQLDAKAINLIIQHESGGDPHAINLTDSNAAAGHPSKGLMQCIDSTFSSNAVPGHNDIYNPVDNILAGVRYAIGRYGSLSNVPGVKAVASGGSYVGY